MSQNQPRAGSGRHSGSPKSKSKRSSRETKTRAWPTDLKNRETRLKGPQSIKKPQLAAEAMRLELSVHEARSLFHNLMTDVHKLSDEEVLRLVRDGAEVDGVTRTDAELRALAGPRMTRQWDAISVAMRDAHEMARFALTIPELDDREHDVAIFKGYCQDHDGLEPVDESKTQEMGRLNEEYQNSMALCAQYRVQMPAKLEAQLVEEAAGRRAAIKRSRAELQNLSNRISTARMESMTGVHIKTEPGEEPERSPNLGELTDLVRMPEITEKLDKIGRKVAARSGDPLQFMKQEHF